MENRRSVPGNDMVDRGRGCWTIDISASFIPEVAVSYDSKATLSDGWSEGVCVYREYRYSIGDSEWTWNNRCGCQEGK